MYEAAFFFGARWRNYFGYSSMAVAYTHQHIAQNVILAYLFYPFSYKTIILQCKTIVFLLFVKLM